MGRIGLLVAATLLAGCASWRTDVEPSSSGGLPAPRRSDDVAVLEVAFVSIRLDQPEDDIWQWVDETIVDAAPRRQLARNGIRIGRVQQVADFPPRLDRIRREPTATDESLEAAGIESELSHDFRRISCRVGKRYELPTRQVNPEPQNVLVRLGDETTGRTLSRLQPLLALRTTSVDARSLQLSLRPELQYGQMRQVWVGTDAALRLDNRRQSWSLEELEIDMRLQQGAMLVAGTVDPPIGLGRQMFTGLTAEGDDDQVLMIIRVAELPDLLPL